MECYRRAMIAEQTLEGRRENVRGLMIEIFAMHADLALMVVPRNLLVTMFFYPTRATGHCLVGHGTSPTLR